MIINIEIIRILIPFIRRHCYWARTVAYDSGSADDQYESHCAYSGARAMFRKQ